MRLRRLLPRIVLAQVLVAAWLVVPRAAEAATACGPSAGHTVCITVSSGTLSGPAQVTVTNSPNSGIVIVSWVPSGGSSMTLIHRGSPRPQSNDYSFVWPTQKYLDASGVLRVQYTSSGEAVELAVGLSNGNLTDIQRSPNDWQSFLPGPWTQPTDPLVVAVGDAAANVAPANALIDAIVQANPGLFLYLGDIYDTGTYTETLNHYGENSMDGGAGTLLGRLGHITQPTLGNHEDSQEPAWRDYFHGRPLYTSFRFGNVLFFDLASDNASIGVGSTQYNYVNSVLTSTTNPPPPCIVAFFHRPVLDKSDLSTTRLPIWSLLTNNGGDLLIAGHSHRMIQYLPLNDQMQLPSPGQRTMVELVSGSGGFDMSSTYTADPRIEWGLGRTPGALHLKLNGAASGGTPTSMSWAFKATNGSELSSGSRDCRQGDASPPTISGFAPQSGPAGTQVGIAGTGFLGATGVTLNGANVPTFTVDSDTQITATVPAGAGSGTFSVTTPAGTATSAGSFTVTVSPPPTISGFSPGDGPVGTSVAIDGTGLSGATDVRFGATSATTFTVDSDTRITALVPTGASSGSISVTTPGGTATSAGSFTVTVSPPPTISGFSPSVGPVGTSVAIAGTGLLGTTAVTLNGATVPSFTVDSDTQVTVIVPAGATSGAFSLTTPGGTATSAGGFTVTPAISGFSPVSGPIGTSVTVTGSSLTGATGVRFATTSASFTVVSDTQIVATVPIGASSGPISVDAPGGTATSATSFTVVPPPSITGFSPGSGPVGTTVTLDGSALTGATAVRFGATAATSFTVVSDTRVTAAVPAGAASGPISVTTPGGTATSAAAFTVTPTITGFSPGSGPVGTSVTISGTTLTDASEVWFGSTPATTFTVVTDSQVTATVPVGAVTGPLSVVTPGGTAMSAAAFAVTITFGATDDTYVDQKLPGANYGQATSFIVDNKPVDNGLLRFTVDVGTRSIVDAKLRIYCVDASPIGGTLYRADPSFAWSEATATWNLSPQSVGTGLATLGAVKVGTWYEIDLSSLVQGNGTYSLRMTTTSTNGADYATKERVGGLGPRIVVTVGP